MVVNNYLLPDARYEMGGEMGGLIDDGVHRALQMSAGNLSMKYLDFFFFFPTIVCCCFFLVFSDGASKVDCGNVVSSAS